VKLYFGTGVLWIILLHGRRCSYKVCMGMVFRGTGADKSQPQQLSRTKDSVIFQSQEESPAAVASYKKKLRSSDER